MRNGIKNDVYDVNTICYYKTTNTPYYAVGTKDSADSKIFFGIDYCERMSINYSDKKWLWSVRLCVLAFTCISAQGIDFRRCHEFMGTETLLLQCKEVSRCT